MSAKNLINNVFWKQRWDIRYLRDAMLEKNLKNSFRSSNSCIIIAQSPQCFSWIPLLRNGISRVPGSDLWLKGRPVLGEMLFQSPEQEQIE